MPSLLSALNGLLGLVSGFVIGLIPLIVLHEFGHLLMAKLNGVWAREFGIGYPPRIITLFRWKETEFTLNWIPFGGFVRLEGENLLETEDQKPPPDPEQASHALYSKSPWRRILIYLGGPLMNLLTAWVIAVLLFTSGVPMMRTVVTDVAPGSPAEEAQIQPGDIPIAVAGQPVEDPMELSTLIQEHLGEPVEITLQRGEDIVRVTLTPRVNPPEGQGSIGVVIAGEPITDTLKRYAFPEAIARGTSYFVSMGVMTALLPVYAIRLGLPFEQARPVGIIGISQIAEQSVNESLQQNALYPFLNLVIMLSVSLGIFNLLPIPALDGGRILFSLIEGLRGKALTPQLQERIHFVALMVMLVLFVAITILDIVMPVPLP